VKAVLGVCCVALLVLAFASGSADAAASKSALKLRAKQRAAAMHTLLQSKPRATFAEFQAQGAMPGDDHLSQIQDFLNAQAAADEAEAAEATDDAEGEDVALVQTGAKVGKVQSFCEICILVMQMKERGQPHLCAGLNDQYYVTCVEVLISLLRADKALVYWLKNGCMHMDATGPEIVRPCPAINICSWIPNLFSQPPSIVRDGVESMCPKDNKFLPTIPQEYKSLIPKDKAADGKDE